MRTDKRSRRMGTRNVFVFSYLNDVSSLSSPSASSSDPPLLLSPLLLPRTLLAARDVAGVFSLEVAGVDCLERAFRDTVLPLSKRACFRKSRIL